MSVSVQQILGFLRAVAPQELALDWDNVGLLVDAGHIKSLTFGGHIIIASLLFFFVVIIDKS